MDWIESYLSNRYQAVWIDHVMSEFLKSTVGVSQGSNLGPLLFLIYFNDLPANLCGSVDSYADDTTITVAGNSVEVVEALLEKDCVRVSNWMQQNMLKINPEKTHVMTVGSKARIAMLPRKLNVKMGNVTLEQSNSQLLLGCWIEDSLKWTKQISFLVSKLVTRLNALNHLRYICPFTVRKNLAEGLFNSTLVYCLPVFGGMDHQHIKDVQILQNKVARIVCNAPPRSNRAELFKKLGWLTFNQLSHYHTLISVFKILKANEPEYLAGHLNNFSRNGRIMIPKYRLTLTGDSFCFKGSKYWNQLPHSIRSIEKVPLFKRKLRTWILDNIPRFLD